MSDDTPQNRPKNRGQFGKGQSGNPGGRPKGIHAAVQAKCGARGEKLIELLWLYAHGTDGQIKKKFGCKYGPRHEARLEAIKELRDMGYGRPAQAVTFQDPDGAPVTFTLHLTGPLTHAR